MEDWESWYPNNNNNNNNTKYNQILNSLIINEIKRNNKLFT